MLTRPSLFLFITTVTLAIAYGRAGKEGAAEATDQAHSSSSSRLSQLEILGYSQSDYDTSVKQREKRLIRFSNLLPEEKKLFLQSRSKGKAFVVGGHFILGYYELLEADAVFPNDPEVKSLIGMVYLDLRLFAEAESLYRESLVMLPLNRAHRYNYAESLFVQHKYEAAMEQFQIVRKLLKEPGNQLYSMCTIKLQLCYLGMMKTAAKADQKNILAAYQREIAKGKSSVFQPMYYYSHVVDALHQQDEAKAWLWRKHARFVFPQENLHKPFVDALIESGYVRSYYGPGESSPVLK